MNTELINYYLNLLILQYKGKTKAEQTVYEVIAAIMIYDLMRQVENGYNIETAVGVQLDVLGKYPGVQRRLFGTDFTRDYYGYAIYADAVPFTYQPMIDYSEEAGDVQFMRYEDDLSDLFELNDEELRLVLQLKIVQNYSNASLYDIDEVILAYFGTDPTITDNLDMTIDYEFPTAQERLVTIAASLDLIPKPAGVFRTIAFV